MYAFSAFKVKKQITESVVKIGSLKKEGME